MNKDLALRIETLEKIKKENIDKHTDGFKSFLTKQSIIPLALGIIIGQTTKDVVNSLVSGVLTPLLSLMLSPISKGNSLQNYELQIGESVFLIGDFVSSLMEMVLIMLVIYVVVGVALRQSKLIGLEKEKEIEKSIEKVKKPPKKSPKKSTSKGKTPKELKV
jgi:large conductance mechanosensitive channel protein